MSATVDLSGLSPLIKLNERSMPGEMPIQIVHLLASWVQDLNPGELQACFEKTGYVDLFNGSFKVLAPNERAFRLEGAKEYPELKKDFLDYATCLLDASAKAQKALEEAKVLGRGERLTLDDAKLTTLKTGLYEVIAPLRRAKELNEKMARQGNIAKFLFKQGDGPGRSARFFDAESDACHSKVIGECIKTIQGLDLPGQRSDSQKIRSR